MNRRQEKKIRNKSNCHVRETIKDTKVSTPVKTKLHKHKLQTWRPPTPNPGNTGEVDFRIKNKQINNRKDDNIY